tara:strand:+ start:21 stop:2732 length:2712 start_codon:yes stop_codon:yes gene_type:complete
MNNDSKVELKEILLNSDFAQGDTNFLADLTKYGIFYYIYVDVVRNYFMNELSNNWIIKLTKKNSEDYYIIHVLHSENKKYISNLADNGHNYVLIDSNKDNTVQLSEGEKSTDYSKDIINYIRDYSLYNAEYIYTGNNKIITKKIEEDDIVMDHIHFNNTNEIEKIEEYIKDVYLVGTNIQILKNPNNWYRVQWSKSYIDVSTGKYDSDNKWVTINYDNKTKKLEVNFDINIYGDEDYVNDTITTYNTNKTKIHEKVKSILEYYQSFPAPEIKSFKIYYDKNDVSNVRYMGGTYYIDSDFLGQSYNYVQTSYYYYNNQHYSRKKQSALYINNQPIYKNQRNYYIYLNNDNKWHIAKLIGRSSRESQNPWINDREIVIAIESGETNIRNIIENSFEYSTTPIVKLPIDRLSYEREITFLNKKTVNSDITTYTNDFIIGVFKLVRYKNQENGVPILVNDDFFYYKNSLILGDDTTYYLYKNNQDKWSVSSNKDIKNMNDNDIINKDVYNDYSHIKLFVGWDSILFKDMKLINIPNSFTIYYNTKTYPYDEKKILGKYTLISRSKWAINDIIDSEDQKFINLNFPIWQQITSKEQTHYIYVDINNIWSWSSKFKTGKEFYLEDKDLAVNDHPLKNTNNSLPISIYSVYYKNNIEEILKSLNYSLNKYVEEEESVGTYLYFTKNIEIKKNNKSDYSNHHIRIGSTYIDQELKLFNSALTTSTNIANDLKKNWKIKILYNNCSPLIQINKEYTFVDVTFNSGEYRIKLPRKTLESDVVETGSYNVEFYYRNSPNNNIKNLIKQIKEYHDNNTLFVQSTCSENIGVLIVDPAGDEGIEGDAEEDYDANFNFNMPDGKGIKNMYNTPNNKHFSLLFNNVITTTNTNSNKKNNIVITKEQQLNKIRRKKNIY